MMEPHATIAAWDGDKLTRLDVEPDDRLGQARRGRDPRHSHGEGPARSRPIIGGGFGGKLFLRADAVAGGARRQAAGPPGQGGVASAADPNNTTHRPATIQRIRIGADRDGTITAIAP